LGMRTDVQSLVEQYIWNVRPGSNVQRVASSLGISRRTLLREHDRLRLPEPSTLLGWSRVLVAPCLLSSSRAPVSVIAAHVGFSSATALRRAAKRYGSANPSEMRHKGAVQSLVRRFQRSLRCDGLGRR
jgi:transcriptional regulator GlxA family with amidase domain